MVLLLIILAYLVLGMLIGMAAAYYDAKHGILDDGSFYFVVSLFWPFFVIIMICGIFELFIKFFEWFGSQFEKEDDNK